MTTLVELVDSLTTARYDLGSFYWVDVTHINAPDSFYVRPTAYRSHLPGLQAFVGPYDPSNLKLGSIIIYESEKAKSKIRGQVRNIRGQDETLVCDVFALDNGFMESVFPKDMYKPVCDGLPALTLHCQLADCQPKGSHFTKDSIDAMVYYVGDERAKIIVKGKTVDKIVVQMLNSCPEDISTMLALTGYSTLGYGNNAASRMPYVEQPRLYYTYKNVRQGETLRVRVQHGKCLKGFYVCGVEEYCDYTNWIKDFTTNIRMEKDFPPEDLKVGVPIVVHDGMRYQRAIIRKVITPRKKALVQYVDWGNMDEISIDGDRLKPLLKEYYFHKPALAIFCAADPRQAWDPCLQRFLYQGYEFNITIKKLGNELETPHVVHMATIRMTELNKAKDK